MKDLIIENLEIYLSIFVTLIGLLCSTITFFLKFIKNAKSRKKTEELLKITENIISFMEEAEQHINFTGQEKKAYVISRVLEKTLNYNMHITTNDISDKIEELIELTNQVNINKVKEKEISFNSIQDNSKELARLK